MNARRCAAVAWACGWIAATQLACPAAPLAPRAAATKAAAPAEAAPAGRAAAQRQQLFVAVNARRERAGRPPLVRDEALDLAAQRHAEAMLQHDYFSHRDRQGRSAAQRASAAGYEGRIIAENLAVESGAHGSGTASRVAELWADSRGHRRNLLNSAYARTGVGYAAGGDAERPKIYWVQLYAQ
jgi:uncharacterized protein YkwD